MGISYIKHLQLSSTALQLERGASKNRSVRGKWGAGLRSGLHGGQWGHRHDNCGTSVRGHFISRSCQRETQTHTSCLLLFVLPPVFEQLRGLALLIPAYALLKDTSATTDEGCREQFLINSSCIHNTVGCNCHWFLTTQGSNVLLFWGIFMHNWDVFLGCIR